MQSLYRELHLLGNRLPKRDKLGLHGNIEKVCLEALRLGIQSSLEKDKLNSIRALRINIEMLKHLVRTECDLKIIQEKSYLFLQEKLREISKEAAGWEKYAHKSPWQRELL